MGAGLDEDRSSGRRGALSIDHPFGRRPSRYVPVPSALLVLLPCAAMRAGPVTRFAPSPTGHLHIGGARTALYNWALARAGGRFLLRIEDTDQARSSDDAARGILEDLAWLGIDWDEGPAFGALGGDPRGVGRGARPSGSTHYAAAVERADRARPRLSRVRDQRRARGAARGGARREAQLPLPPRARTSTARPRSRAWRARSTWCASGCPREPVAVVDRVLGEIEFGEEHLDDFVIRKRDGFPTYHFAVVVDDELMGVTHVLRGQEHLNNTPRHVALQRALGYREPVYAHLPLIFNADGSKMSKRDKDRAAREALKRSRASPIRRRATRVAGLHAAFELKVAARQARAARPARQLDAARRRARLELPWIEVEDFRRAGYLPEALCNYLALLGWSPGEKDEQGRDRERFDRAYLAEHFSLERIGAGNARFDREKLLAFNQDAIAGARRRRVLRASGAHGASAMRRTVSRGTRAGGAAIAAMIRTRCRTLADASATNGPGAFALGRGRAVVYEPAAVEQWLRKGDPNGFARLREAAAALASSIPSSPRRSRPP